MQTCSSPPAGLVHGSVGDKSEDGSESVVSVSIRSRSRSRSRESVCALRHGRNRGRRRGRGRSSGRGASRGRGRVKGRGTRDRSVGRASRIRDSVD